MPADPNPVDASREAAPLLGAEPPVLPVTHVVDMSEQERRDLQMHHAVFSAIYGASIKTTRDVEPHPFFYAAKLGINITICCFMVSNCLFRFFTTKQFVHELFKVPGLNEAPIEWVDNVARVLGGSSFLADAVLTVRSTNKSLSPLCLSANWRSSLGAFSKDFMSGEYPRVAVIACLANFFRAQAGVSTMFTDEFSRIPVVGNRLMLAETAIGYLTGMNAIICFFLFQVGNKSQYVKRSYAALEHDQENWNAFKVMHNKLIFEKNRQGVLLGLASAMTSAIGIFYRGGAFSLTWLDLVLCSVLPFAFYFNLMRSITQVNKLEIFKRLHEKQHCDQCETTPSEQQSRFNKIMPYLGFYNSIGEAAVYSYSLLSMAQIIMRALSSASKEYADNPWVILGFILLALPIAYRAGEQGFSMRASMFLENKRPKVAVDPTLTAINGIPTSVSNASLATI